MDDGENVGSDQETHDSGQADGGGPDQSDSAQQSNDASDPGGADGGSGDQQASDQGGSDSNSNESDGAASTDTGNPVDNAAANAADAQNGNTDNDSTGSEPAPIDGDTGSAVAEAAASVAQDYNQRGVTWVMGGDAADDGGSSDCSHFVNDVLGQAGVDVPYVTTETIRDDHPNYRPIDASEARPGDILVEGDHMGIYTGTDDNGDPLGVQMGKHGAKNLRWGPNGYFNHTEDLEYYRPVPAAESTASENSGQSG